MELLKPNAQRANTLTVTLYAMIVSTILYAAGILIHILILEKLIFVDLNEEFQNLINGAALGFSAIIYIVVNIITIITFILWFRRAYFNLHILFRGLSYSEGWASGCWFVPIANFYIPYQIMREMWDCTFSRVSHYDSSFENRSELVGLWWGFFIGPNIFFTILEKMYNEESTGYWVVNLVQVIFTLLSTIITIKMVKAYNEMEKVSYQRHSEEQYATPEDLIGSEPSVNYKE